MLVLGDVISSPSVLKSVQGRIDPTWLYIRYRSLVDLQTFIGLVSFSSLPCLFQYSYIVGRYHPVHETTHYL